MFKGNWNYPTAIKAGAGCIRELPQICKDLGMAAPLLVTDPGLADSEMVKSIVSACRNEGLQVGVFSQIKGNPTAENINAGVTAFRKGQHDGVIAFGGGSGLDAGKTIALMAGQQRSLWDFEDIGDNWTRVDPKGMAPVVAVPTTAGTGSEVGRAAVITDADNHVKRLIFHPNMLPVQVILDPKLTVGLPPKLTAATGMDALSHNLEAYCAPGYHPLAEGIAVEGIRLVHKHLQTACEHPNNLEARMQMLVASTMGATAFQRGLGAMHALAHPLGALYDAHHGLLNAILMPYVLVTNRRSIEPAITRLSAAIDLDDASFDGFLEWVLTLRQSIGIPNTLAEIGLTDSKAKQIGEMAIADAASGSNPIALSAHEYAELFCRAITGDLSPQ